MSSLMERRTFRAGEVDSVKWEVRSQKLEREQLPDSAGTSGFGVTRVLFLTSGFSLLT
jgi:hypothetical protein